MIVSAEQTLSKNQAVSASVASTNVIDLGDTGTPLNSPSALLRDLGKGEKFAIDMTIANSPIPTGHLVIDLQVSNDELFGVPNVLTSVDLNSVNHPPYRNDGYRFNIPILRRVNARYLRLFYNHIDGDWKFNAMFVAAEQTNPS
ncbi:unnamed protein product [marine sediment metagenome]|uniref:Uncharacterized protein n=1 Tax=marine sediment metagenome TaxID=412755 RepID=X1IS95_9ZZZZ